MARWQAVQPPVGQQLRKKRGDEKKAAKAILDAIILKHQARRWASAS